MIQKLKDKHILKYVLLSLPFFAILSVIVFIGYGKYRKNEGTVHATGADIVEEARQELGLSEEVEEITEEESSEEEEEQKENGTVIKEDSVPNALSDESIHISDIYALEYEDARLISFMPGEKVSYTWEKYDVIKRIWEPIDAKEGYDDLYRKISYIDIKAHNNDIYRCTISGVGDENIVDNCRVRTLGGRVMDISISDMEYDALSYMNSGNIPVTLTMEDGSKQEVSGLNGLYFVEEVSSEPVYTDGEHGEIIKTVTVTTTYRRNAYVENDLNEVKLMYDNLDKEIEINVTGSDLEAPTINNATFDYVTSNSDSNVEVKVTVDASDNITPLPNLKYALVKEGVKVSDKDYTEDISFTKKIDKNGKYILYVKDEAGNISTYEEELIVIDTKDPVIKSISLSAVNWCPNEDIIVDASDGSPLKYRYKLKSGSIDSDWIDESRYEINQNGIYEVSVKDKGEHIITQSIEVSNIDNTMPIINNISIIRGD